MTITKLEAIKLGEKFYDSKTCGGCGGTKRYVTTGNCPTCGYNATKRSRDRVRDAIANAEALRLSGKVTQEQLNGLNSDQFQALLQALVGVK